MGTTVIGGMLGATGIAIFIIPALYVIVERVSSLRKRRAPASAPVSVPEPTPVHGD
jgi:hypothetical protein